MNWMEILDWAAQAENGAAPAQDMKPMLIMFVSIGLLAYFLLIRPQKKEQQKRQELLDSVAKGDSVVTAGGIHGKVESVDKEKGTVTLVLAPKMSPITFNRASVTTIVKKKGKPGEEGKPETQEA